MQFCITLGFRLLLTLEFNKVNLHGTLGSSKSRSPAHERTEASAVPGRKPATPLGRYSEVCAGVQAPRRQENETARELMFFFFWQETRQKIGSRSCPLPAPPAQAARALQGLRAPAARPRRFRAPRASRLAPRACGHVHAPARRVAELAAGRRGPGCGRRLSAALVSAALCLPARRAWGC